MTSPDAAPDIRQVVEALNTGQTEAAYAACLVLLQRSPPSPSLDQLASTAALRTGRHEEATRFAQRSLASRPDHVATLVLLGRAARAAQAPEQAAAALMRVVELAPETAEAAFLLRLAWLEAGRPVEALGLDRLGQRFPGESAGWDELSQALLAKGDREAALFCLSASSQAAPSFALAMRRALLCRDLGRRAQARHAFEEAVTLRPDSGRAWFLLGVASQDLGDLAAAALAYRRALALDATLAEAALNLGSLLQEQGDLHGAKAFYAQAVRMRPDVFGRAAQALTTSPKGELWLDLHRLRRSFEG